jgi:hypothetical protein
MKKPKDVAPVDRQRFEEVIGRLLKTAPVKRSEAKIGGSKRTGKVRLAKPK